MRPSPRVTSHCSQQTDIEPLAGGGERASKPKSIRAQPSSRSSSFWLERGSLGTPLEICKPARSRSKRSVRSLRVLSASGDETPSWGDMKRSPWSCTPGEESTNLTHAPKWVKPSHGRVWGRSKHPNWNPLWLHFRKGGSAGEGDLKVGWGHQCLKNQRGTNASVMFLAAPLTRCFEVHGRIGLVRWPLRGVFKGWCRSIGWRVSLVGGKGWPGDCQAIRLIFFRLTGPKAGPRPFL